MERTILDIISDKGGRELLMLLAKKDDGCSWKDLRREIRLSTRILSERLRDYVNFGLLSHDPNIRLYKITTVGLIAKSQLLDRSELIQQSSAREQITFGQEDYFDETSYIAMRAHSEILATTRWLRTFKNRSSERRFRLINTFREVSGKINMRLIADPGIDPEMCQFLYKELKTDIKFIPLSLLENPPGRLKPIILEDFSHVLIADRKHWLYLEKHKDEEEHMGVRAINDPAVAEYLAEIFDTFWELAKYIKPS